MSFIYVGRLDELKGIKLLFQAWRLMGVDAPKLLVCGTGPLEDWCKEYIKENHLSSVEMKGFVPNTEARKLIANSEALILPTQWYEGFPMTIVEAYSVGTPVIASDLGNAGAVVIDAVTGYKFNADSSESLEYVVKIFESTQDIDWKSNVLCEYKDKYSPERNYKMLSSVYDRVKEQAALKISGGGYRTPILFPFYPDHISTESVAA